MREKPHVFSNPLAPIRKSPLYAASGLQSSRFSIILNDDDGAEVEVGNVSSDYNLVPNTEVVDAAEAIMLKADLTYQVGKTVFDGHRFTQQFIIDDPMFHIVMPKRGDILKATLDVVNSYDGSTKFGVSFNMWRMICSNGMMMNQMLGGFRFKHNAQSPEAFEKEIREAVDKVLLMAEGLPKLLPYLDQMENTTISKAHTFRIFDTLGVAEATQARVLRAAEGDCDNLWQLLNGFTSVYSKDRTFGSDTANAKAVALCLKEVGYGVKVLNA